MKKQIKTDSEARLFAPEIETAVLGAVLLESGCYYQVKDLTAAHFSGYRSDVWQAIQALSAKNTPIDLITVVQALKGKVGPYEVAALTTSVNSSANIEAHAYILKEYGLKRLLFELSGNIQRNLNEKDPLELWAEISATANSLNQTQKETIKTGREAVMEAVNKLEIDALKGSAGDIYTGFRAFDNVTGGGQNGELIILAGRPGSGKTALALQIAYNNAMENTKGLLFSLEMTAKQLGARLASIVSAKAKNKNINLQSFRTLKTTQKEDITAFELEAIRTASDVEKLDNIMIDSDVSQNIIQLCAKARALVKSQGYQYIIVDYLQLIKGTKQNREQEISEVVRELKNLAVTLNIPIIALSQLNREVEKRTDKRPKLSDLRESGEIENSADMIVLLYRPSYYGITVDVDNFGQAVPLPDPNVLYCNIAKFRGGAPGEIPLLYLPSVNLVTDLGETDGSEFDIEPPKAFTFPKNTAKAFESEGGEIPF